MLVPPKPSGHEEIFLRRHARHARGLRVVTRSEGVVVEGSVDSYYRKQLLLRDAAAFWGPYAVRADITVRRSLTSPQPARAATANSRKVLLAAADPAVLDRCSAELTRHGYDVTAVGNGLGCLANLRAGGYDTLVIVGRLPWGGSNGLLELASSAGYLDRTRAIYVGDRGGLESLSDTVVDRLSLVSVLSDRVEQLVVAAVDGEPTGGKRSPTPVDG